jgi:hypothetical protein
MPYFAHYFHSMSPLVQSASASLSSSDSALLSIVILFLFGIFALIALVFVSNWIIFQKAGKPGWASIIPFYNRVVALDIAGKPLWWVLFLIIPFVNIVFLVIVARRIAANFGHGRWFMVGMIFLPFIFLPILAFGKSSYQNVSPMSAPLSEFTKWAFIALFASAIISIPYTLLFSGIGTANQGPSQPLTIIDADAGYAADDNYVYYQDKVVDGADPVSFAMVGSYGVDDNNVYYAGAVLAKADPKTFEAVGEKYSLYAKDASSVYYADKMLSGADPATFELVGHSSYAKDSHAVYLSDTLITGIADPSSFESLGDSYVKDNRDVYYLDTSGTAYRAIPVSKADRETFRTDYDEKGTYDAHDKNVFYKYGFAIKK